MKYEAIICFHVFRANAVIDAAREGREAGQLMDLN